MEDEFAEVGDIRLNTLRDYTAEAKMSLYTQMSKETEEQFGFDEEIDDLDAIAEGASEDEGAPPLRFQGSDAEGSAESDAESDMGGEREGGTHKTQGNDDAAGGDEDEEDEDDDGELVSNRNTRLSWEP